MMDLSKIFYRLLLFVVFDVTFVTSDDTDSVIVLSVCPSFQPIVTTVLRQNGDDTNQLAVPVLRRKNCKEGNKFT